MLLQQTSYMIVIDHDCNVQDLRQLTDSTAIHLFVFRLLRIGACGAETETEKVTLKVKLWRNMLFLQIIDWLLFSNKKPASQQETVSLSDLPSDSLEIVSLTFVGHQKSNFQT